MGQAKYLKFILSTKLDTVLEVVGFPQGSLGEKNCGDLKLIYSFYDRGSGSVIPYDYPGKNY